MAAILTGLERHDVLFVDEIHRLNRAIEEILYSGARGLPARHHRRAGRGGAHADARPAAVHAVGATTRTGLLTTPLRDRFGMTFRLDYYDAAELGRSSAARRASSTWRSRTTPADEIARRSRGTPRIANRILKRVRDVAQVRHDGVITNAVASEALELLEVDGSGSSGSTASCSRAILVKFDGGPVGLSTLAVALGEEPDTIEDVYEPYLLQLGFLQRTPRGRVITALGREHSARAADDAKLF
jgi:Holliday junction DNA helicase RuvB